MKNIDISFIEVCQSVPRQKELLAMRHASLDEFRRLIPDAAEAEQMYNAFHGAKEGYLRITRQYPSLDSPREGWSYAFAEGIPLDLDNPDRWYSTSIVQHIDWEGHTFTTLNSVYSFEFIDKK